MVGGLGVEPSTLAFQTSEYTDFLSTLMVLREGLEPSRFLGQRLLRPLWLPITPPELIWYSHGELNSRFTGWKPGVLTIRRWERECFGTPPWIWTKSYYLIRVVVWPVDDRGVNGASDRNRTCMPRTEGFKPPVYTISPLRHMVLSHGIEPQLIESKSIVLPLDEERIWCGI